MSGLRELNDLDVNERTVLLACCDANNYSLGSHVPIQAIMRRIKGVSQKVVKRAIRTLLSNGFIVKHPTRNQMTYQLSRKGLIAGNTIRGR